MIHSRGKIHLIEVSRILDGVIIYPYYHLAEPDSRPIVACYKSAYFVENIIISGQLT